MCRRGGDSRLKVVVVSVIVVVIVLAVAFWSVVVIVVVIGNCGGDGRRHGGGGHRGWSWDWLVITTVGHHVRWSLWRRVDGGDAGDRGGGGDGSGRCRLEGSGAWKPIENGNERKT